MTFSRRELVGSVVFQTCKTTPTLLEVKNIRTAPVFEGRLIAKFNLRNVEVESRENYSGIICDIHKYRRDLFNFLFVSGYRPICNTPLYTGDMIETIMFKPLGIKKNKLDTFFPIQ